jgi:hypothetical protein
MVLGTPSDLPTTGWGSYSLFSELSFRGKLLPYISVHQGLVEREYLGLALIELCE